MIVAKFGGTAITPRNLICLKHIIGPAHAFVVVSAVGREFKQDAKVTDLLLKYFVRPSEEIWEKIADKYRRLVVENGVKADVEALLASAQKRALCFDKAYCLSLGEELSARIAAAFLGAEYTEAQDVVRFDAAGRFCEEQTYKNIRVAADGKLRVMGGFYGGSPNGRCTFPRGGGDISGAIAAAALNASIYENWTDVNGVCVADPTKVHGVASVDGMSYAEMRLLSRAGAEVLHCDAILPCEKLAIPIKIGNFFDPNFPGTLISSCPSRCKLLSIAEKKVKNGYVTTALHSYPQWQIVSRISDFLRSRTAQLRLGSKIYTVDSGVSVAFSKNSARFFSSESLLKDLYAALK